MENTDVVIIGAGPTGLTLAVTLAARGVPVRIFDRAAAGANTSRAAVVHAHTMDILEPLGVTELLIPKGLVVPQFSARHRDRPLVTVDFRSQPSRHPFALMVPQSTTEQVLTARLTELGIQVHRGWEVSEFTQDRDGVTVDVSGDDRKQQIRARYLVGADGLHSAVRTRAGIDFQGDRYPQHLALADVRMDWPLSRQEGEIFFAPDGLMVVVPLPDNRFRIVGTVPGDASQPDIGLLQTMVDRRGPQHGSVQVHEVVWSSLFSVHHRLAATFRNGRVLLAGDAAHVHSPAGGQGMNLGIADAVELGGLLADLHEGIPADLDAYEQRRRPRAAAVISLTDRMTRAATTQNPALQAVRDTAVRIAAGFPGLRHRLAAELAGLR